MNIGEKISRHLQANGSSLIGFADLTLLPAELRYGLPRAVAFAVALAPEIIASIEKGPTREYYAEYERANRLLGELSNSAADVLRQAGFMAKSSAATNEGIDPITHSTLLPHKTVATLAGLGWIGKCALLITEEYGSAIRLNRVLTDAPLPTGLPVAESHCGDCRVCVEACPGSAPTGDPWIPGKRREDFFHALTCRQTALQLAEQNTGIIHSFCGICIAVCPWTQKYLKRSPAV